VGLGLSDPLPDYVSIVMEARSWGVTPMEYLEFPAYWAEAGRIVAEAEDEARRQVEARRAKG